MKQEALVLLLPGLGDALVASPIIRRLQESGVTADALTMLGSVTDYARGLRHFRDVIELPLLSEPSKALAPLAKLRAKRYDYTILPFPATRWHYWFLTRAIAAKRIISHDYRRPQQRIFFFGSRARLVPLKGGHRISENARLADAVVPGPADLRYLLPDAWTEVPKVVGLLGVNTGTMRYKGNEARRWPLERFIEVIEAALDGGRAVRIFLGPNERDDLATLTQRFGSRVEFVVKPLPEAAKALSQCEVFLGNDAGLTHVASGLGVKTVSLFGMTSPVRAAPLGTGRVIAPSPCPPCHDEGSRDFSCVLRIGHRCMQVDLTPATVSQVIDELFEADADAIEPVLESDYRLYGRSFSAGEPTAGRILTRVS